MSRLGAVHPAQILLGDITIDVVRRRMRSIRLRVLAPLGHVRMSAPFRLALDTLRHFALAHAGWIRKQQLRVRQQPRETPHELIEGESHLVWGQRYLLKLEEVKGKPSVEPRADEIVLRVRPGATRRARALVFDAWHREELRKAAASIFAKWEPVMGVKVGRLFVQHMRTRWGTCNTRTRGIRLNTELVRRPPECLEYVIVHEMTHLLEPSHNRRFKALMTQFMPDWVEQRRRLNRLPLGREPREGAGLQTGGRAETSVKDLAARPRIHVG